MVQLQGFYKEETLQELLYKGNISRLEYSYHASQERIDDFREYCQENSLQEDEKSAEMFFDYLLKREEIEHTDLLD